MIGDKAERLDWYFCLILALLVGMSVLGCAGNYQSLAVPDDNYEQALRTFEQSKSKSLSLQTIDGPVEGVLRMIDYPRRTLILTTNGNAFDSSDTLEVSVDRIEGWRLRHSATTDILFLSALVGVIVIVYVVSRAYVGVDS